MEQPEEATAEAEAESRRVLRLVDEGRVVELQLLERVLQVRVLLGVGRKQAGEDHRLDRAIARQGGDSRPVGGGHGVADPCVRDILDGRREVADLTGAELAERAHRGHGALRRVAFLAASDQLSLEVPTKSSILI